MDQKDLHRKRIATFITSSVQGEAFDLSNCTLWKRIALMSCIQDMENQRSETGKIGRLHHINIEHKLDPGSSMYLVDVTRNIILVQRNKSASGLIPSLLCRDCNGLLQPLNHLTSKQSVMYLQFSSFFERMDMQSQLYLYYALYCRKPLHHLSWTKLTAIYLLISF